MQEMRDVEGGDAVTRLERAVRGEVHGRVEDHWVGHSDRIAREFAAPEVQPLRQKRACTNK